MAISDTFQFEELDSHSREYLLQARDNRGKGLPGIFVPITNSLPGVGCFFGIVFVIVTAIVTFNIMEEEPLAVAMLQTAGFMLGGWMIVAAFRIWTSAKSKRYIGHFVYADAETLWECNGSKVVTTDIYDIVEARGVQNYKEGKYQNTALTVHTSSGRRELIVHHEVRGRDLIIFLNTIAWMRSGGKGDGGDNIRADEDINYKKLDPEIMGGLAKEQAETGSMPRKITAKALDLDVEDVPVPKREGRASTGILNCLIIIALGAVCLLMFRALNVSWRDDAIWEEINKFQEHEKDKRAPWLRAYLSDERNTKHREDARQMLRDIYTATVARIRNAAINNLAPNPPLLGGGLPPMNFGGDRVDKDLVDGLAVVLMELAELNAPIVSVSVKEKGGGAGGEAAVKEREKKVMEKYTLALLDGVGQELVAFVEAPPDTPGMIDITYEYGKGNPKDFGGGWRIIFTLAFRKSPDGDPVKTVKKAIPSQAPSTADIDTLVSKLGLQTAGPKKIVIQPIDF